VNVDSPPDAIFCRCECGRNRFGYVNTTPFAYRGIHSCLSLITLGVLKLPGDGFLAVLDE
jgi:hypothetical protein